MKAIIHDHYGPLENLEQRDIEPPRVGEREVLVRVHAAAVHIGDVFAMLGSPFPVRLATGLRRPRYGVPGFDLAGTVEAVGAGATRFRVGDEVLGCGEGTAAELATTREDLLVPKPASLTFEQAAAIPTSALAALHGLRDAGRLVPGQRVLINGASGGVGTFAIQIARALGAESVTGVTSTANVELVRSLGADDVIDYTREDFTRRAGSWDLIFDQIENRSLGELRHALTPTGRLVLNSGTGSSGVGMLVRLARPIVLSPFGSQKMVRFVSNPNRSDLERLAGLVDARQLCPFVGRTFPLHDTVAALQHVQGGHARGKVVLAV